MASSIESTSSTTTLKNNGNTYMSVDTNDIVALTNPLPLASGGTGAVSVNGVVQTVNTQNGGAGSGTTAIPWDDTIPQNTEGDEYINRSITPKNTNNILHIDVTLVLSNNAATVQTAALFQDTTASAIAAAGVYIDTADKGYTLTFKHKMVAGTTSATTFKVRSGGQSGTTTLNGAGSRKYGGVSASSITITEYTA